MWRSASLPAPPVCASSRCGAAGRCCSSRPKTRWPWCASAWKALRLPPRSPLPRCRCKSLPPHHSGWTPPPTGCASPRRSKQQHPVLLILDPLIRLHRVDENDATQIAALLSYLRELQRQFQLAVLLVHHARKDSQSSRPGQALRGSSELHGWGDSNLYMRRKGSQLTLSTEHRAAPSRDHIPLQLTQSGSALALTVSGTAPSPQPDTPPTPIERVRQALAQLQEPISGSAVAKALWHSHRQRLLRPGRTLRHRVKSFVTPEATNSNCRCPFPAL